ncbi:MAG: RagB/SusD family nutrient uptake outer membrane protein [Cyclobacteriaceae bacterium]
MKLSKKIMIASFIALISISACHTLEEEPIGLLSPDGFFKTRTDVETGLNGAYSAIASEEIWGRKLTLALLLRGDMADIGDPTTTAARIQVDEFQMDATNGMILELWPKGFEALATVNYTIEGAENLENIELEAKNALIAEGRFIRGFIYYHYVRLFGKIPYINFPFKDPARAYTIEETSVEGIYDGIIADFTYAKEWLPDMQAFRSRPSKGTAAAYLASVYLTLGENDPSNWQNAYDEAKYVIDNKGTFGYDLAEEYQNLFDATVIDDINNAKELVFAIDFRGLDESSLSGFGDYTRDYIPSVTGPRGDERFANGEGWSVAVPALAVFEEWPHGDYRKDVAFDTVTIMGDTSTHYRYWGQASRGIARPHIAKYYRAFGNASLNGRDSDHNYAAMRYAEVLLIAAEALNEINNGPTSEAADYINEVRIRARRELDDDPSNDRAIPANISLSDYNQDSFRNFVLEERRYELAFEFGRWYDIKRRQLGNVAFGPNGLEPNTNFDENRDYLFPKPQFDLNLNDNLEQNTGY